MSGTSKPMPVTLLEWRPMVRNSLLGFAKIQIGALQISDVTVHSSNGKRWASLPSKPMVGADGVARKDDSGKIKYVAILGWSNKDTADRFSEAVTGAVEERYPDTFPV